MNVNRFNETLAAINAFGFSDKGMNRIAYTKEIQDALNYLAALFKKEGMTVTVDAIGNMIARREGNVPGLPAVACGSHIDTVYNGGRYDGIIGVVGGLEIVRYLNENNIATKHPIEIIVFACEESARFGVSTIGSKAMTGLLEKKELIALQDKQGISICEAMEKMGYCADDLATAKRKADELKVFYEMHIEQGPVLETEKKQVGIVTGIAAPTRFKLQIIGESAHSGSTPMSLRKDALSGASEIALTLEAIARKEEENGTVATIGNCEIPAGAMNVVPGEAHLIIDIRSISQTSKNRVKNALLQIIKSVEKRRNIQINLTKLSDEEPTVLDGRMIQSMKEVSEKLDISYLEMPSGAGHDAMNMAKVFPTGMIFVPSKKGISHNKKEFTSPEEIITGMTLLREIMLQEAHIVSKAYC